MSFEFYADSGLTTPLASLAVTQAVGGAPVDRIVYFGSTNAAEQLQRASTPGVDPVQVSVVDSDPVTGLPTTAVRLALSAGDLGTATPGAALDLPATIAGGVANAVAVFVRIDHGSATHAVFDDLSLRVAGVVVS
jgi:hypothetical protein